ncbi:MAG TPA: ABC transporter permease [Candidatus Dormibacteraeota bacterium]|nr:ABC transporter permease [Candidatus Dormibacteraeota bacterium]
MLNIPRSLRSLASRPVFPAVAVATLALGLGVNAAIFSLTREVLLRPLPYRDADRLVRVFETSRTLGMASAPIAPVNYIEWRDLVDAFEQTAVFRRVAFNVSMRTSAMQVEGFQVAPAFFPMLGIEPALGRGFTDEDAQPGRDAVVLLSNGFWRRQFAADSAIVGQSIDVDGAPCTVVGVLPSSFKIFRVLNREVDLFRPFVLDATDREQSINVYAKLKPGVALNSARAQMTTVYSSLPIPDHLWTADVALLSTSFAANSRPILLALEWAAAFVLLIACANIANLLLAVSAGRRKELAIRQALGASRWQIARDFAGETLILTVAGGALAILLATWIVTGLNAAVSFQDINRLQPFRVDAWVVAFTGGLTLAVTLIFGVLPAHAAADADVVDALKDSTHGVTAGMPNRGLRHALIVGELALSIVLTASALALTRSALALHSFARGVTVDGVMTAQVALNDPRYADTERLVRVAASMLERLSTSPGIDAAALVNYPPLSVIRVGVPVTIEGQPPPPGQLWIARYWVTAPGYFHTAGIRLLVGRDFTSADDRTRGGVAIVSETFAQRFWNTTDVVGRRLRPTFPKSNAFWIPRASGEMLTIVGVVGDVRENGLPDAAGLPQLYLPYAQNPTSTLTLMARVSGRPAETATRAIRDAVRAADPQLAVSYEKSFDDVIQETFARPRELAWFLGAFAVLALVLSAVGVYGVMAYLTTARTREIGIRIALGATRVDIVSLIVGRAMALTAAGVAIGIVLAPMALRLTRGLLFGVGPFDPVTLLTVAALLAGVSIVASTIPAFRAARLASASFR